MRFVSLDGDNMSKLADNGMVAAQIAETLNQCQVTFQAIAGSSQIVITARCDRPEPLDILFGLVRPVTLRRDDNGVKKIVFDASALVDLKILNLGDI